MREKIRIMQLGSPSSLYGAERWILALVKNLDPELIESWIAIIQDTPDINGSLCVEAKKLCIKTKVFEVYGQVNLSAIGQLKKFIIEHDINILHTHFYKADIIGLLATIGTQCKLISTPHGWSQEADVKLWCYEIFDRMTFPFFNRIIPLSEDLYRSLQHIPGLKKKLHLIKNGIDLSEIQAEQCIAQEVEAWKKEGTFVIGYIGQLIGRKGLDMLLYSVASLPGTLNWRLAIIGEGEKREELELLSKELGLSNRVTFFGFRHDRLSFLKGFDTFVLPSKREGIPRCLMEAMAAEIPIIASDIPGCREIIVHEKNGLLFPLNQPQKIATCLARMANTPNLQSQLARSGQELITQIYSATRMAKKYEQLFLDLVQEVRTKR